MLKPCNPVSYPKDASEHCELRHDVVELKDVVLEATLDPENISCIYEPSYMGSRCLIT